MRVLFAILSVGFFSNLTAQSQEQPIQKIGFADTDYILNQLPEFKKIDSELKTHASQLENQMKAKYDDYQVKLRTYQSMPATTPDAIKADKEGELTAIQQSIEKFKQDAQSSYQKKQSDLLEPIQVKIGNVISDVARENGYSFILGPEIPNAGLILLWKDDKFNISDLVLKKMGVTPAPQATKKAN